jgi:hypothetical protein
MLALGARLHDDGTLEPHAVLVSVRRIAELLDRLDEEVVLFGLRTPTFSGRPQARMW